MCWVSVAPGSNGPWSVGFCLGIMAWGLKCWGSYVIAYRSVLRAKLSTSQTANCQFDLIYRLLLSAGGQTAKKGKLQNVKLVKCQTGEMPKLRNVELSEC